MSNENGLMLWVLGGSGVVLIYAAYKGASPLSVIQNHISGSGTKPLTLADTVTTNPGQGTIPVAPDQTYGGQYSANQTADASGTQYVYDSNGNVVGTVPKAYAGSPGTYMGSGG